MSAEYPHPVIPSLLIEANFRFIKIKPKSKSPAEVGYTTDNNYAADDLPMVIWLRHYHSYESKEGEHFEGYGNYALLCDAEHIVLDFDTPEIILEYEHAVTMGKLPSTFTTQSGSGKGLHAVYRTKNSRIIPLSDPNNPVDNVGHIKGAKHDGTPGSYAVGPTSIHDKTGRPYIVLSEMPVANVDFQDIVDWFSPYISARDKKARAYVQKPTETRQGTSGGNLNSYLSLRIEDIAMPDKAVFNGQGEYQGAHPIHGSTGGMNFSINTLKQTFHCYRCGSGAGVAEYVAVTEGLIKCEDAFPKCLSGSKFLQICEILKDKYGQEKEVDEFFRNNGRKKAIKREAAVLPKILDTEPVRTDILPDRLPDTRITLVDALPRIGKTYWAILMMLLSLSASFFSQNHGVVAHAWKIFLKQRKPYQTGVYIEGKTRVCRKSAGKGVCTECHLFPHDGDYANYMKFGEWTHDLLYTKGALSHEDFAADVCPYWALRRAEEVANFVFTTISSYDYVEARDLEVFDEDTTISYFYPSSVDVATVNASAADTGIKNEIARLHKPIRKYENYLKTPKIHYREPQQAIINILHQIDDILTDGQENRENRDVIEERLNEIDMHITLPESLDQHGLLNIIMDHESPKGSISPFAEAILNIYEEKHFELQFGKPAHIRMIANEEVPVRKIHATAKKLLFIGSTRTRQFIKTLNETDITSIELKTFVPADAFLFVIIKENETHDEESSTYRNFSRNMMAFLKAKIETDERIPWLFMCGTKEDANTRGRHFGAGAYICTDDREVGMRWNHSNGFACFFTQGSVIVRGQDVPQYHGLSLESTGFANPYWQTKYNVAAEKKDKVAMAEINGIIDAYLMDETTNGVVRIAPTITTTHPTPLTHPLTTRTDPPKLVFVSENDVWKIKPSVLEQVEKKVVTERAAIAILENTQLWIDRTVLLRSQSAYPGMQQGGIENGPDPSCARSFNVVESSPSRIELIAVFEKLEAAYLSDYLKQFGTEFVGTVELLILAEIGRLNQKPQYPSFQAICKWGALRRKDYTMRLISEVLHRMIVTGSLIRLPDERLAVRDRQLHEVAVDQTSLQGNE